jgi:hypothetical protein
MKSETAPEDQADATGWQVCDRDGHVVYRGTDPGLADDPYQTLPGGHLQQLPPRRSPAEPPE